MKGWTVAISIGALVCVGIVGLVVVACLTSGTCSQTGSGPFLFLLLGGVFAFIAGVLSAVNAGHLRHPVWSGLLALMTLLGVVSHCGGWLNGLGYADAYPPPPDAVRLTTALILTPLVVLPLAGLLSAFLLRPGKPKPAVPPAGAS
jgi:hypothetical protein